MVRGWRTPPDRVAVNLTETELAAAGPVRNACEPPAASPAGVGGACGSGRGTCPWAAACHASLRTRGTLLARCEFTWRPPAASRPPVTLAATVGALAQSPRPLTATEVAAWIGRSRQRAQQLLAQGLGRALVAHTPDGYTVTPAGVAWLAAQPPTVTVARDPDA